MNESQVLQMIMDVVIANGNNEITANVLRPVLIAMLQQPNDEIGDLDSLQTAAKNNLVDAINELTGSTGGGIAILTGTTDPNLIPPAGAVIGDFYIWNDGTLRGFYQFNGTDWVLVDSANISEFLSDDVDNIAVLGTDGKIFVPRAKIEDVIGLDDALDDKVDKIAGKQLSDENYTIEEKDKLAGLESSKWLGVFQSIEALELAHPTAEAGNYADVDAGTGVDTIRFLWDETDDKFVQSGSGAALTPAQIKQMYESNPDTNVFTNDEKSKLASITEIFTTALKNAYDGAVSWISTNGTNLIDHLSKTDNPHNVTKEQVGLGDVPNTDFTNDINSRLFKDGDTSKNRVAIWSSSSGNGVKSNDKFTYNTDTGVLKLVSVDGTFETVNTGAYFGIINKIQSGGWSRPLLDFRSETDEIYFLISVYGTGQDFEYAYWGKSHNDAALKIKDKFVSVGLPGITSPQYPFEVAGAFKVFLDKTVHFEEIATFEKNLSVSTIGSTLASPRILGLTDFAIGRAARLQFGDAYNCVQSAHAKGMDIYSYNTLRLRAGETSSPKVLSFQDNIQDVAVSIETIVGSKSIVTKGASNQTVDIHQVRDIDDNVLHAVSAKGVVKKKVFTVAALPAGTIGDTAVVSDAVSPTYLGPLTGGGSVACPVLHNGTSWVSH